MQELCGHEGLFLMAVLYNSRVNIVVLFGFLLDHYQQWRPMRALPSQTGYFGIETDQ